MIRYKIFCFLSLFITINASAEFTLNNNISAGFDHDVVNVFVTSNTVCNNAGVTKEELVGMISEAVNKYWNTVASSRLVLKSAGFLQTTNSDYLTGQLCDPDLSTCTGSTIPKAADIVVTCNNDTTFNFPNEGIPATEPSSKLALALPNNISGGKIIGSVIVINDRADNPFKDLSYAQKVATIAHEIGHAFGLGHSDQASSLMYFRVQQIRQALGIDDVRGVTYLYPVRVDGCGLLTIASTNKKDPPKQEGPFIPTMLLGFLLIYLVRKLVPRARHLAS